jgi:hypothetical protein
MLEADQEKNYAIEQDFWHEDIMREAASRITALENACRAYLDAYDSATGTVYVEPVIRAVMEGV